mgnify:CR=1 FL=1
MAYVDYSSHWVLDQFLTFLEANQLGSNDEHLYDSLAVEHNVNTATVDGTHKANSIVGSYINTVPISTGSQVVTAVVTWTPVAGVYQIVTIAVTQGDTTYLELYISGAWRSGNNTYTTGGPDGVIFCDGTNMRFGATASLTVWYQKF